MGGVSSQHMFPSCPFFKPKTCLLDECSTPCCKENRTVGLLFLLFVREQRATRHCIIRTNRRPEPKHWELFAEDQYTHDDSLILAHPILFLSLLAHVPHTKRFTVDW